MSRIIIGIHGLGNKPPFEKLQQWWLESIISGLKRNKLPLRKFKFELVYWADLTHEFPLDENIEDHTNPLYLDEPYSSKYALPKDLTHTSRKSFLKFLEKQMDRLLLNDDLTINFSAVSDSIIKHFFRDLNIYYSIKRQNGVLIKDLIRDRLRKVLEKYQHKKILLIAHSMGSIIAYDVLSIFSEHYNVDTFVTIGSPLGIPAIMSKIAAELQLDIQHKNKLAVPDSIKSAWFNLSDLEDKVAINFDLSDDYIFNKYNILISDKQVFNDYINNGKRNPHKSYGYLRTQETASIIDHFCSEGRTKLSLWFEQLLLKMRLLKD